MIYGRLLASHSQQKSYADYRVQVVVFMDGDHVWLCVSPMKSVIRLRKKASLALDSLNLLIFESSGRVGL